MERIKIVFCIVLGLLVPAFALQFPSSPVTSGITISIPIILLGFQIASTLRIRHFSKRYFNLGILSIKDLLMWIEKQHEYNSRARFQLVHAIEAIGNSQIIDTHGFDVEGLEAVQKLQSKLHAAKQEETQRAWSAKAIAHINEIREHNTGIVDYANQVTASLVKSLEANQAVFYIKHDEDEENSFLEMLASYACIREDHHCEKAKINLGSGLIGQCAVEGKPILLNNVPRGYMKISSGLGEALPRAISVSPFLFRNEVFGVIEIASLNELLPYQLEFLRRACETIAFELSDIKNQEQQRKALEQSREEELRQNIEDLKNTQMEMMAKEEELNKQLLSTQRAMAMADAERKKNEAILEGCMDAVVSFNQLGTIQCFNKAAEEIFGLSRAHVLNGDIRKILALQIVADQSNNLHIITNTGSEVSLRTEVNAIDAKGEEISLLLTATNVRIDEECLFTLFAQKVSVELF